MLNTFELERLYFGSITNCSVDKENIALYQVQTSNGLRYIEATMVGNDETMNRYYSPKQVKIKFPFKNLLTKEGIAILLNDENMVERKNITSSHIKFYLDTIRFKNKLTPIQLEEIAKISQTAACIISDLLGFNISVKPSTTMDLNASKSIVDVIVPGKKLLIFNSTLEQYIRASLYKDNNIIIFNDKNERDYRISRSLKKASIKKDGITKNSFTIKITQTGIELDKKYAYEVEKGMQKVIKF
ncbi:MAG: hypothetical protein RSB71_02990 [Bacilli bacterium]